MTTHTCMGCGLKTRYSYWRNCTGCGLDTRCSYVREWPDRYQQAAVAFARVVSLGEKHPTAALALLVPGSLIAMAAVAAYPLVFVPSLILLTLAMGAAVRYEDARTPRK
ncbi:hypothetical protein [Mycobacterium sp. MUNTM1]